MRSLLVAMLWLVLAGTAVAAPAMPAAGSKLGMESKVMAGLRTVETAQAGDLAVTCNVSVGTVPVVQCFAKRAGAQHPASFVAAHFVCATSGSDSRPVSKCSARPVCTYQWSLSSGRSGIANVCVKGWVSRLK